MIARVCRIVGCFLPVCNPLIEFAADQNPAVSGQTAVRKTSQPLTPEQQQHVRERLMASKAKREADLKAAAVRLDAFRAAFEKRKADALAQENERVMAEIRRLSRSPSSPR
jgi:hypothetical protein